jgi:hypothetical protein
MFIGNVDIALDIYIDTCWMPELVNLVAPGAIGGGPVGSADIEYLHARVEFLGNEDVPGRVDCYPPGLAEVIVVTS